jgi:hypothetical protein
VNEFSISYPPEMPLPFGKADSYVNNYGTRIWEIVETQYPRSEWIKIETASREVPLTRDYADPTLRLRTVLRAVKARYPHLIAIKHPSMFCLLDGMQEVPPAPRPAVKIKEREPVLKSSNEPIPFEFVVWSGKDIERYMRRPWKQIQEHIVKAEGFPAPIILPTKDGRKSSPLWQAIEVIQYVLSQKEKKAS